MKRWREHLGRVDRDGMLRHGVLVLGLLHIGSATNLLFHMSMGRLLSESEYGVLAALLGAFFMFYTPLFFSMQNTMSHFSSHLASEGRPGDIRALVTQWARRCAVGGGVAFVLVLLLRSVLAARMHLESSVSVVLLAGILFGSLFMPVFAGAFQGLQKFVWMSVSSHLWTLIRLGAAIALVLLVAPRADWVMAAHLLGVLGGVLAGVWALCRFVPKNVEPIAVTAEKGGRYFFGSLIGLFFYSALMNTDMVMVKMFFADEADYGPYARASVIGRLIVFVGQPIAGALFPKVAARGGMKAEALGALLKAVALAAVLIGGITLFFAVYPAFPLKLLFGAGDAAPELVKTVRIVACAMMPLGLVFLMMNFELAQNRFAVLWPMAFCALLFVGGFSCYHPSPCWAGWWLLSASVSAALLLVGLIVFQRKRMSRKP